MKKKLFVALVLFLILLNACKESDYREQWTGKYSCKVHSVCGIGNIGEAVDTIFIDTMKVSLEADSCLMVSSMSCNRAWTFKVDEFGNIDSGYINSKVHTQSIGVFSKDEISFIYKELGVNVSRQYEVEGYRISANKRTKM